MATFVPNVTDIFPEPALYRPDFSFLDTMLRRRQAMYNQGFAELSSKYSALAKNLTNPYNSQVRNQFLTAAQKELKNLSAMDLSQQQNVQTASNVFTPLYSDKNVMTDLALTSHWDQQEKIAESFRLKDGGKEFSQANIDYVRMQRNDFANDRPDAGGQYLANKRYYSPYKDYSAKFLIAYEKFKPSSEDLEYVDGAYIRSKKDASVRAVEFKRYLESVLTPEEKRQIQIEGIVKYGNSPQTLIGAYQQKAVSESKIIDNQIENYTKQLKLAKSADDKETLKQTIDYFKTKKKTINDNYTKLSTMDNATIRSIKDNVAGELYYDEVVNNFSLAAERTDIKTGVQANSVWTTIYSNQQQWARQKDSQRFELEKMQKEAELKALYGDGSGTGNPTSSGIYTGNNVQLKASKINQYGLAGMENDILAAKQGIVNAEQNIVSHLIATNQSADSGTVKAFIEKYSKISNNIEPVIAGGKITGFQYRDSKKPVEVQVLSDLEAFQKWQKEVGPNQMVINSLQSAKQQLNAEVKKQASSYFTTIENTLAGIGGGKSIPVIISGNKPVTLNAKDIFDGLESGSMSMKYTQSGPLVSGSMTGVPSGGNTYFGIVIGGKTYNLDQPNNRQLRELVNGVLKVKQSSEYKNIGQVRQKVYGSDLINNNPLALFDPNSGFYKDKVGEVEQIFGKPMQIRGGNPMDGALAVSPKDEASTQEVLERARGRADITYDETNDLFYVKGLKGLNVISSLPASLQSVYKAATIPVKGKKEDAGVYSLESAPFKIGNLPYDFQWKRITREADGVDGTKSLSYEYFIYDGNNKQVPLLGNMTNAFQLVEQISKLESNPVKAVQLVEGQK